MSKVHFHAHVWYSVSVLNFCMSWRSFRLKFCYTYRVNELDLQITETRDRWNCTETFLVFYFMGLFLSHKSSGRIMEGVFKMSSKAAGHLAVSQTFLSLIHRLVCWKIFVYTIALCVKKMKQLPSELNENLVPPRAEYKEKAQLAW